MFDGVTTEITLEIIQKKDKPITFFKFNNCMYVCMYNVFRDDKIIIFIKSLHWIYNNNN